jgi:hypothetical protein
MFLFPLGDLTCRRSEGRAFLLVTAHIQQLLADLVFWYKAVLEISLKEDLIAKSQLPEICLMMPVYFAERQAGI